MSIKERRERQKQATREGILNAALEIARAEGWTAVTVRQVAERVEYSSPIIYQYFANKDAMLEELQTRGFALLTAALQRASAESGDARGRLLRIGDAYLLFAYDQPELYELMHGGNSQGLPLDKTLAQATLAADVVQACVEEWLAEQKIVLPDLMGALYIVWAALHGLVSVEMLGRLGGGRERVRELGKQAIVALLTAWTVQGAAE